MDRRTQRILAVTFSILIVTATLTPASAAHYSPNYSQTDSSLTDSLTNLLIEFDALPEIPNAGNGNGNGKGKNTSRTTTATTTTPPETTTAEPPGGPPTTTQKTTEEPPGNETGGPPGNKTQGPPGNKTTGAPGNKTTGPPEDPGPPGNKTTGPPENRGPPEDRGPPEWAQNPETPPSVAHNRSALANQSKPLANASVNVTIHDDASAADYRLAAIAALQQAEFDGPGRSAQRHRIAALKALNKSLQYLLDANRTTSAVLFEHDKEASTPPQFAPNVTKLLVHSDEQLATTAIADAERIRKTLRARNVSFDESAVEENITAAKAAVERAERFRNRGQHHTAISQYRVAWIHAQQALDVLDLATTPNVTITSRGDLPHEGNATYELRGRVFDVRGHELTAVVSLNGVNRTLMLDVNATPETTPGAVATFRTNLTLSEQVNTIEVRATDPNRRWAPDHPDANATTGRDRLLLDGDGLPDTYEQNVVGTDPLNPDSNATYTNRNESGNNISDGAEDLDSDGETIYEAYRFGTNPLDNDTDDDRLLDGFELQFQGLDPTTNDTDNDTIADSAEDLDNDTLSNYREQNASTSPVQPDTDADGLNDSAEVVNGTDPLAPDTDSDGLTDPDEYEVGTDPTVADTDGDGVLDGNETFSTSKTDAKTGVSINITGEGNAASTLSINNSTEPLVQTDSVENVSASAAYDFEAAANFSTANITLPYNESRVGDANESNLGAYRYNETLQTLVPVTNSTVDTRNDTVTAETSHFSTYTVLSTEKWEARFNESLPSKWSNSENFSDLDRWRQDGNVSMGTVEDVETSLVSATRTENDTGEESTAVVGSIYRITERNWTIPKDNKTTDEDETTTTTTTTTTETPSSDEYCKQALNCDPTETTTTAEHVTTQDAREDSDGDNVYDRNDECPDKPGEGDDGCEKHSDDDGIRDWNDECDDRVGEGDGCPTDSDDDGTINYNDKCENTPGLGEDGCAIHSDKDDYNDYNDDCPELPGTGADGCPIDDDGDGTRNFYDKCPEFPGWKDDGCPRESSLERTVTLRDAETITLGTIAKANAVSKRSVAQLVVVGPDGDRIEVYGEENTPESTTDSIIRSKGIIPGGEGDAHGDFEAVEHDLSEFAGEEVTIKVETVGRATFEIDALKIGYDTDGDTIYDAIERASCGLRDGSGQCLDTDPYLADTDGDGLSDSQEIGPRKQAHGHVYRYLNSNPTVRDTDHDGLSDRQEVKQNFQMAVTRSPEASRKYLNGQSPSDKQEHLYTKTVDSDPLKYDTDGDGLNDRQEWLYKTNPRNKDSDDDGRLDGRERAVGEDPTLHDYRPPDIRLQRYGYITHYSKGKVEYVLEYFTFDPSGVTQTKVIKNGGARYQASPNELFSRHDGSFNVTGLALIGDEFAGANVDVSATDSHGNTKTKTAIRRANALGRVAGELDADTIYAESVAAQLGRFSGFSAGVGGTVKSVLSFVRNPLGFVESLGELIELVDKSGLGIVSMMINAMGEELQNKQETNNPYEKGTALYDDFRYNWWAGYTVAFIAKAIVGGQATKAIKTSKYADAVTDFAKSTRAGRTAMRVKAPYDRGKARVATGLARAGGKAAGPILRRAKSAGAAYRLWKLQRKAEVDTVDLSEAEHRRVSRFLARHGEDGAETLRRMDSESIKRMFRKTCGVGTARRTGGGCNQLDEEELQDYATAVEQADVELGPFYNKIDDTDVSETAAERFVADTGPAGLRLAVKLDSNSFERLVKIDADAQDAIVEAWRSDTLDVSTEGVQTALRRLNSLESSKKTEAIHLLEDVGGEGVNLIIGVSDSSLEKILKLDTKYSREARGNLAQKLSEGDVSADKIEQFATDYPSVRHKDGFEGIVQDIAKQDEVDGPIYEVRAAAKIGPDRIHRLSTDVGTSGEKGELDIVLKNGDVIEVKDNEWGQLGVSQYKDIEKKIDASTSHKSMDGKTIIYVIKDLGVSNERKKEFLEGMEEKAKEEYGVSIEIKIKDDLSKV